MNLLRANHDPIMTPLFHPSSCRSPRLWVAGPVNEIADACATGLVGAIVTNPDVLAAWVKADGQPPEQTAARYASLQVTRRGTAVAMPFASELEHPIRQ